MTQPTLKVTLLPQSARAPSPVPETTTYLRVPKAQVYPTRTDEATYSWGEEENELIKSFGALSTSLGLPKSLSTSDINLEVQKNIRAWISEENLSGGQTDKFDALFPQKLEPISRSCSTWVAVGDVASASQLPSPHTRLSSTPSPAITAVDFVLSVNKKVRQNYIKKRLRLSYRLLKSLSEIDNAQIFMQEKPTSPRPGSGNSVLGSSSQLPPPREVLDLLRGGASASPAGFSAKASPLNLTAKDVERDRGRQLSRYERNIIIFNWLQTLEGGDFEPTV